VKDIAVAGQSNARVGLAVLAEGRTFPWKTRGKNKRKNLPEILDFMMSNDFPLFSLQKIMASHFNSRMCPFRRSIKRGVQFCGLNLDVFVDVHHILSLLKAASHSVTKSALKRGRNSCCSKRLLTRPDPP